MRHLGNSYCSCQVLSRARLPARADGAEDEGGKSVRGEHSRMAEGGGPGVSREASALVRRRKQHRQAQRPNRLVRVCIRHGSSSGSHLSVPAPFIPCFEIKRVAQGWRGLISIQGPGKDPALAAGAVGLPTARVPLLAGTAQGGLPCPPGLSS